MKYLVVLVMVLFVVVVAGGEPEKPPIKAPQISSDNSPRAVQDAERRGAQTAAEDINAGRVVILYYGKPWSVGKPLVDDATGLPVKIVGGCDVTGVFVAEVAAYNEAIRAWHAKKNSSATP